MPLFRFVKQAASLAQKRCAASPTAVVNDPAGNGFADWKHLTLHFLRIHMDATYREIVDWASEMDCVRGLLQLARTDFPAPSTLWRSFERVPTRVWRQLLRRSATRCDPGEHGAMDDTFFDREAASNHYIDRSDRHIRTLKTTALVDTESCAVLDLHCSAHWPHDTQVGRRVALRNTEESRVSPVTKAMTINLCGTHSAPKASGRSSDTGCSRTTITHTTHLWKRCYPNRPPLATK